MDNSAVARIATSDLAEETLALLMAHGTEDDVVFFLGRLIWQGKMANCAPALTEIACDRSRGRYARIAAIRGVMSLGDNVQNYRLLERVAEEPGLERAVLAEVIDWAVPNSRSVDLILRALLHVEQTQSSSVTGLEYALHAYIDRLPVMDDASQDHPLGRTVKGFSELLMRKPHVERGQCKVSEEFAWLMSPALHAVDRLVSARSRQACHPAVIHVMRNEPALRFWRGTQVNEYRSSLAQNVPPWTELNDLLYWASIEIARTELQQGETSQSLLDDWQVAYVGRFWSFGPEDFERCLGWAKTKDGDDRLVALGRSIQIYVDANRPAGWLTLLRESVRNDATMSMYLEGRLNPQPSPALQEMEAENRSWKRKAELRQRKERKDRADWVRALKADPDRILHPPRLKPGELSRDQYHLLVGSMGDSLTNRAAANWRALIPEFGEAVARAYRDSAVAHWRVYAPASRADGAAANSIPYALIFAMTGLAIEASEENNFAEGLSDIDARHAFRYITWELNGFPEWFESVYRAHPELGREFVRHELLWELENSEAGEPKHHILHDIFYHAPWLHAEVSPILLDWLIDHDIPNDDDLRHCLSILLGGGVLHSALASLAARKLEPPERDQHRPHWFALWVDTDPAAAIPALEAQLRTLSPEEASEFAQLFVVYLLGDRHGTGVRADAFRTARHLKALYVLMHTYMPIADDIVRPGNTAYSPTLRDNAQDARSRLFNLLVEVPGEETYLAIKDLELIHPEPHYRKTMTLRAHERATLDADEPAWTTEHVRAFQFSIDDR